MSAECSTCGADLTYRNWPVGECEPCNLRAEIAELQDALRRIADICPTDGPILAASLRVNEAGRIARKAIGRPVGEVRE